MPATLNQRPATPSEAPRTRILVVEDERIVALDLRQKLARLGYEVTATVASGAQALREIDRTNPDLILMDIHIEGDMDGIETTGLIPPELRIPVIYLTAYSEDATLARARSTHSYGYLLKPFSDRALHATIQMAVERSKLDLALHQSEERLSLALDSAEMGSWEFDAKTRSIVHMAGADRIFPDGQSIFTGAGKSLFDHIPLEHRPHIEAMFEKLASDGLAGDVEFRWAAQEGDRWVKVSGKQFHGEANNAKRFIGVMQDVTQHRENQERLHNTIAELAAQRVQLSAARHNASRGNRAKSDFLAVMSYELRTPMIAILGFCELLGSQTLGVLNRNQDEYLGNILKSGRHLMSLIDDLLDLGKIDKLRLELEIERVELAPFMEGVAAALDGHARKNQILLTTEAQGDLAVAADATRLSQVLNTVVSNAITFGRPGGVVRISDSERTGNLRRITVAESGIGIPARRHDKVFEPFSRRRVENGVEGDVIGLQIAKQLVELMGGAIGFESDPDVGSTFWIDLPSHRPPRRS